MLNIPGAIGIWRVAVAAIGALALVSARARAFIGRWLGRAIWLGAIAALVLVIGNAVFSVRPGVPHRALDPASSACLDGADTGWDILARNTAPFIANDEWAAIDAAGGDWRAKLSCAIQHHTLGNADDPNAAPLSYDLAFLEFQEDGKPYALRNPCSGAQPSCVDEGYGPVARGAHYQLDALLDYLCQRGADKKCSGDPHYVMVFIHGWRHNGGIGDSNVGDLRQYAAHAARFMRARAAADPSAKAPRVTAVFVGWRGARTDEIALQRRFGRVGAWIGQALAVFTLFDRKPVSEAIAPSVLTALRAIEQTLGIVKAPAPNATPAQGQNRMIVFGHSLGGNMLATALRDDLVKAVDRHEPGEYLPAPLGDLVVLINPASEATKWTDVQRAVWRRIAVSASERRPLDEYTSGHAFFRADQRPVVVSATAARDWPPGGRRELDCAVPVAQQETKAKMEESRQMAARGVDYDTATYDLFPTFKLDFRPIADTLQRKLTGVDPHDSCAGLAREDGGLWRSVATFFIDLLRFAPYQETDPELTRTIGNYDPPRAARGSPRQDFMSGRPFGTTHELRGRTGGPARAMTGPTEPPHEIPVDYDKIDRPATDCPIAKGWLSLARAKQIARDRGGHGMFWASADAGADAPALLFRHGFQHAGLSPITRANDPFWNMRAFDTALARHDGYLLSSFICALNQLVMDDPVAARAPPTIAGDAGATPVAPRPEALATPRALVAPERAE